MPDADYKIRPTSRYMEGNRKRFQKDDLRKRVGDNYIGVFNVTPKEAMKQFGVKNSLKS